MICTDCYLWGKKNMKKRLGDIATYVNGYAFKPSDRGLEGLPIIRIQDLTGNSYDLGYYNGTYPSKIEINDGDVLISWSASLGIYVWDRGKALLNQHIFKVLFDKIEINKWYFVFSVKYKLQEMELKTHGATMKHIVKKDFDNILIPFPTLEKQNNIASILLKIKKIIIVRQQQLDDLDKLVKARFVEMFGDPITNEMGWEKVQLSTCIESIDNGKSLVCDASARQGNWPAVLKLSAATYGFYRPEENKALFDENQFVEDAAVRAGDLLFTRKNTPELVGMCAYVYDTPSRLMMPDLIFRLNTTNKCNKMFLWKLINHDLFRDCIQAIATGSAKSMSNISKERLLSLEIILPPAELQEQFAAFVAQTDKSKFRLERNTKTFCQMLYCAIIICYRICSLNDYIERKTRERQSGYGGQMR